MVFFVVASWQLLGGVSDTDITPTINWRWALPPRDVDVTDAELAQARVLRFVPGGTRAPYLSGTDFSISVPKADSGSAPRFHRLVVLDSTGQIQRLTPISVDSVSCRFALPIGVKKFALETPIAELEVALYHYRLALAAGVVPPLLFSEENKPAELFARTLTGEIITRVSVRGQVVVVFQTASWCSNCPAVKHQLEEISTAFPELVVVVFYHDKDETKATRDKQIAHLPRSWKIGEFPENDDARLALTGGANVLLPHLTLIGRDGMVSAPVSTSDLQPLKQRIEVLLEKK